MICIWSSGCHCHPVISCFIKIQIGLTFLVSAYPGCPEKVAVKQMSVSVCSCSSLLTVLEQKNLQIGRHWQGCVQECGGIFVSHSSMAEVVCSTTYTRSAVEKANCCIVHHLVVCLQCLMLSVL